MTPHTTTIKRLLMAAILLCGGTSCVEDVASRYYGSEKYPPKPEDYIAVLDAAPSWPYKVIADFQSRNESVASMRKRAAALGADAIIVTRFDGSPGPTTQPAGTDHYSDSATRVTATVIKY